MKENNKRGLPIGEASILESKKDVLPAIEVNNTVRWVNHDMETPFNLTEGMSTKLGIFLTPKLRQDVIKVEVSNKHGRSGILGRIIFRDKQGNLYRDVDIKGIGFVGINPVWPTRGELRYIAGKLEPRVTNSITGMEERTEGVATLEDGQKDVFLSEFFYKNKVRAVRPIALVELHEVIDEKGEVISVISAKNKGLISQKCTPALEVRAFVTKARVSDRTNFGRETILKDAKALVAAELNTKLEVFSDRDYLTWFTNTFAEEVGKIHRLGYFHGYLTPHNVTLDCRLLDFDSVIKFEDISQTTLDILRSRMLDGLFSFNIKAMNIQDIARAYDFSEAYKTIFAHFSDQFGLEDEEGQEFLGRLSSGFINTYERVSGEKLKMEQF